ncbi:MAG: UDP-N-acetylmuramoyl-L-alanine--D-glutamate ligase [Lentimicrobium sp.]|jgi:UDP-N-acetylmuramoylalanine--D-glutamate ligase|nr:UDP-N-acetylmuramoyl-L-alanine--D-glutamate ligase [Lentimicrobium sp.]
MRDFLESCFRNKKIVILGYGREGKSTFRLLHDYFPGLPIAVADSNKNLSSGNPELEKDGVTLFSGNEYTHYLSDFDVVIKSPGISLFNANLMNLQPKITSQTDLFLQAYSRQTIGVTGTKGKSTTASLIYHILKSYHNNTIFAGNIGIPLFDMVPMIDAETRIVCEFSSHQLEFIAKAPFISILLNIYQEHLDHYASFRDYQLAKFQIALKQQVGDNFLYNPDDINIQSLLNEFSIPGNKVPVNTDLFEGNGSGRSFKGHFDFRADGVEHFLLPAQPHTQLFGIHNLRNIISAATAALISGIPVEAIVEGVATFKPLKHRMEFLGSHFGKLFYDDSISTIPEACLAAVETLGVVDTLILGGFDRGIDYNSFIDQLCSGKVRHIVFNGPAGERMMKLLQGSECTRITFEMGHSFVDCVSKAIIATPDKGVCLLSPAASSYDSFRNFEERGDRFRELVTGM